MQIVVDGLLTAYQKRGSGKKVILWLHGWGDSVVGFDGLGKFSSETCTSVLLDLPGFGGTERPSRAWDLPDYSDFIAKFIKKLDIDLYMVVGHSNGGAIAINALATRRVSAQKLVLLASSGIRTGTSIKKILHILGAKIAKVFVAILPKSTQKSLKKKLYTRIGSDYMTVEGMQETFKNIIEYDISDEAKQITVPTLLVYGSNDLITPVWQAKKIASAIEDSKLEIIEGAQHFPHKDQPEKVKKMIEDFLQ